MTRCNRFEEEGLLQIERGLPLDDHFATCVDCAAARTSYERLVGAIRTVGGDLAPLADWRQGVWADIDGGRSRRAPARRWWLAPAGLAAAAAVAAVFWPPAGGPRSPGLEVAVERGGIVRRTLDAQPGDRITLRASAGGQPQAELRVYLNDRSVMLRCSTQPPCRRRGDAVEATFTLDARGAYQSVLIVSPAAIPAPAGDLDRDGGAAQQSGATVILGPELQIR